MEKSRRSSCAGIPQPASVLSILSNNTLNNTVNNGAVAVTDCKRAHSPAIEHLRSTMYHRSLDVPSNNRHSSASSRRTSRVNEPVTDMLCSQQSILNAMDRFVKSVNNMQSTVLIPNRLRDMDVNNGRVSPPHPVHADDLHSFFTMLNDVKNELLWGPGSAILSGSSQAAMGSVSMSSILRVPSVTQSHKRQPSSGSLGSAASDPDTDSESISDFGASERDSLEQSMQLASAFRHHLQGLHTILHQLADSADYLAARYQEEVEPSVL